LISDKTLLSRGAKRAHVLHVRGRTSSASRIFARLQPYVAGLSKEKATDTD
jgi:hypothetical protein